MFADEMATRRSVWDYSPKPVPRDVIEACFRTAGAAPSGANRQPWHFVAISNPDVKSKIRAAAEAEEPATEENTRFLEIAPWLIAVFYERAGPELDGHEAERHYPQESTGIAAGFLIAALHKAGLATLVHAPSPMDFLNQILGRPKSEVPYLLLVVGHPSADCRVPDLERKPLSEIAGFIE